jgi:ergothioneine biosynthesis protein EgtB
VNISSLSQESSGNQHHLAIQYKKARAETERLCKPLEVDDFNIQTMPDVSPVKWHIAHVSWFFETFVLMPHLKGYQAFHPQFKHIFNSYYEMVGSFHPRPQRGFLNRPTLEQVWAYRKYVDEAMLELLNDVEHPQVEEIWMRTNVGINHEQQHQELMLTDILHVFASNPLKPAYQKQAPAVAESANPTQWLEQGAGITEIGHYGPDFCYDNETPRHKTYLQDFRIADRAVTNAEYIEFIEAGAYRQSQHWLSDGWKTIQQNKWQAPLYWQKEGGQWWQMSLNGYHPLDENAPVTHISFYEADAYAHWAGKRLPTEAEWESVATQYDIAGNFRESGCLQSQVQNNQLQPFYGDVWEWTQSAYAPYPGYKALPGALGEYNGKFMASQFVLRGGSCFTPREHIRSTYRNFFYPKDQWQCSGFRLAEDLV